MAVTLNYVSLDNFADVMPSDDQAEASDDSDFTDPNEEPTRDDQRVKRFLRRAESLVDSYLITYERPIDDPPMALQYAIYVIARYMLRERGDAEVSEGAQNSYDQAIAWLESIAAGTVDLEPSAEEFGEDFVGHADYSEMEFAEYPFVDKSATYRNTTLG